MPLVAQLKPDELLAVFGPGTRSVLKTRFLLLQALLILGFAVLSGCGAGPVTAGSGNAFFSIVPGSVSIDTNCTGCNSRNGHGNPVDQFAAISSDGSAAHVTWSVSGGDHDAGPGTVSANGEYTPPGYLTADRVQVMVTASLAANPSIKATSQLTVTPGFLQPLTPENVALGANGTVTVTGYLAEAGGSTGISFALADRASGASGGQGSLSPPSCEWSDRAFTRCTVTYTAPTTIAATGVTYLVATAGNFAGKVDAEILLNTAGVASNPASHQGELPGPVELGKARAGTTTTSI